MLSNSLLNDNNAKPGKNGDKSPKNVDNHYTEW